MYVLRVVYIKTWSYMLRVSLLPTITILLLLRLNLVKLLKNKNEKKVREVI